MPYADPEKKKAKQKEYDEKRKEKNGTRHRVWTGVFYPDSASKEWTDLLSELHVKVWVSPLHDKDTWTQVDEKRDKEHKAGTLKKPHHHFIVQYDTQVDSRTVTNDFNFLKGPQVAIQSVRSITSMIRYLIHADDKNKAQYSMNDIKLFGGATLDSIGEVSSKDKGKMLRDMRKCIREHNFIYFDEFFDYCDDCEQEWSYLLDNGYTYPIREYIKSRAYRIEREKCSRCNDGTNGLVKENIELRTLVRELQDKIDKVKEDN